MEGHAYVTTGDICVPSVWDTLHVAGSDVAMGQFSNLLQAAGLLTLFGSGGNLLFCSFRVLGCLEPHMGMLCSAQKYEVQTKTGLLRTILHSRIRGDS